MDDALENLETQNQTITELLEETRQQNISTEERLKQIENDNMQLRGLLDEVREKKTVSITYLINIYFFN